MKLFNVALAWLLLYKTADGEMESDTMEDLALGRHLHGRGRRGGRGGRWGQWGSGWQDGQEANTQEGRRPGGRWSGGRRPGGGVQYGGQFSGQGGRKRGMMCMAYVAATSSDILSDGLLNNPDRLCRNVNGQCVTDGASFCSETFSDLVEVSNSDGTTITAEDCINACTTFTTNACGSCTAIAGRPGGMGRPGGRYRGRFRREQPGRRLGMYAFYANQDCPNAVENGGRVSCLCTERVTVQQTGGVRSGWRGRSNAQCVTDAQAYCTGLAANTPDDFSVPLQDGSIGDKEFSLQACLDFFERGCCNSCTDDSSRK